MANVVTPKFRVSFPNVFKAKKNELSGKEEFSVVALFPKNADLSALKKAAHEACVKKWGEDQKKWPKNIRSPFRDQSEKIKEDENGKKILPAGHEEGAFFMNLKSSMQPQVVDQNVQPILEQSEFYAGCWARASVNAYAYDQAGNKGVSFGLQHLQKVGEGESFGGRVRVEDAFTPVETDGDSSASGMFA